MTPGLSEQMLRAIDRLHKDVEILKTRAHGRARLAQLLDIDFETDALQPHQILRYKSDEQIWVNRYTALFTGPALTFTVAGGAVDVAGATTSTNIVLAGEGGLDDDVDTIDSDQAGHIIVVRRDPGTTITLKDGTGNLRLPADIVLDSDEKAVWLLYTGSNDWIPIAGYGSGATGPVTPHVHAGEDITSGTVADARIASTITRDSEVFTIVLANDGAGSGLDADLLDGLSSAAFALASHVHAGEDITSGTVADARIASTITRDSEVFTIVLAADGSGSGLDADLLDGLSSAAFALASHTHTASQITDFTEAAQDVIGALLVDSSSINYTYDDATNSLTTVVIPGGVDHNSLANLATGDVHTHYLLLAGRAGGQTANGGNAANEDLTLEGTAHATKTSSYVLIQPNGGLTGIGLTVPTVSLQVKGAANAYQALVQANSVTANDYGGIAFNVTTNDAASPLATIRAVRIGSNDVDLDFRGQVDAVSVLYMDMSVRKIGLNNGSPSATFDVIGLATTGPTILATRNLTSTSTDSPVISAIQDHASDDQPVIYARQDGSGAMMELEGETGSSPILISTAGSATAGIILRKANGNLGALTQVLADELMGFFGVRGADGSSYSGSTTGLFGFKAAENFSGANEGVYGVVEVSPIGSQTRREIIRFNSDGRVRVGPSTVTPASILHAYEDSANTGATAGLTVENDGAGDADIHLILTAATTWTLGIDNSVTGDPFVLAASPDLATIPTLQMSTAGLLDIKAGSATGLEARVGGLLFISTSTVGNVLTGEDDLITYTLPASVLAATGDCVVMEAGGTLAANTNIKTLKAHFGNSGTSLIVTGDAININAAHSWHIICHIFRTGAATQKATGIVTIRQTAGGGSSSVQVIYTAALDQTLSGTVVMRITGTGTATNDLVCEWMKVRFEPVNT